METKVEKEAPCEVEDVRIPTPPPNGYVKRIAEAVGVSIPTASHALRYNTQGVKARLVRAKFAELYPQCL